MVVLAARPVADQRLLHGAPGSLNVTFRDSDGEAVDEIGGPVLVTVTRADGTALATAATPTGNTGASAWWYDLTSAQTASLDLLTAVWTAAGVTVATTLHEIVGGYYFSATEARAVDPNTSSKAKYDDADIFDKRREVEDEFERICQCAFVPRYRRVTVSGNGGCSLVLPDPLIRRVRAVRTYTAPTTYADLTADELAGIVANRSGRIDRTLGAFNWGQENIVVAYEHGYDRPPFDVKRAAITRLRERLNSSRSGIPERATSFAAAEGGTYGLATANAFSTGNPDIDAILGGYSFRHP